METIWALVGRANKYILETFLGGMETARQLPGLEQPLDLETFLGGMETLPAPHRSPGLDGDACGNAALRDHANMRKAAHADGLPGKRYTALQRLASILPRER